MTFLQYRLEGITSHKLEIIPMFRFVQGLCGSSSQATKERTKTFLDRWENDVYQKRLHLAYISGSWTPTTLGTHELRFQRPWDEYLRQNYALSLGSTSIGQASPGFKPFNFKELVQMPFWKELYTTFGQKAVAFLFEKCLIIEEVEENFYLVIGTESCTLSQKLSKTTCRKKNATGMDVNVCRSMNPYQLQAHIQNDENVPHPKNINEKKRKRLTSETLSEEFRKKARIEIEPTSQHPSPSEPDARRPENSQGVIRWFIPTVKILEFVIQEREKLKATSRVPSVLHNVSAGTTEVNYIGIFKDDSFLKLAGQDIGAIVKQSCQITFPLKKLPTQWEGLRASEALSSSKTPAYFNVFKISETFARNHQIRIKPKQRRAKKSQNIKHHGQNNNDNLTTAFQKEASQLSQVNQLLLESNPQPSFGKPFDPFLLLGTLPALYNKSSWSRWPKNHILTVACQPSSSHKEGVKIIFDNIFITDVGASINNQVSRTLSSVDTKELSGIIGEVVTFHKRMKNLHRLVKSCLTFWMIKKQKKLDKQEHRKAERERCKALMSSKSRITRNKSIIEMVDLTTDTPSTADPSPELASNSNRTVMEISVNTASGSKSGGHNSSELRLMETSSKQQRRAFAYSKLKEKVPHTCLLMAMKQIFHVNKINKLLGSKKNIRGFFAFLRKSIILAGTKSSLQLGQLMALLDPNDCQWLNPVENSIHKYSILAKVVKWLFTDYVMVILKTSFYITEISDSRLHASFYLRESWKSISEHMKHRFTKSGVLRIVGSMPKRKVQLKPSCDAINARIRYIPKKNNDLRPILSLKRENYPKCDFNKWTMLINHLVRKLSPHRIRDTNVIRQKWCKFLQYWEKMRRPKLYVVRADVQDAYPSVDLPKLKDILLKACQNLGVLSLKDFRVVSSSRVVYRKTLLDEKDREIWNASVLIRPCIVQDTNQQDSKFNAVDVVNQLVSCFKQNVVRIGKHRYSFEYGLPQGWRLSEGLCNVYYGDMDSHYFSGFLNKKGEFLITSVDDYLYITPDPHRASKFYKKMLVGMPDYGCKTNERKISSNIYPRSDIACSDQECEWINFCGWKFCLTCGHMMRDFFSYKGQDMASSLSFNPRNVTSPENFLISRMKIMLPARLHYFLLDPAINCRERIVLNLYDAGFVFAFRFYAICRVIYPTLNAVKDPRRAVYIVSSIYTCTKILCRMVANIFRHTYPAKPSPSGCKNKKHIICPCIKPYTKNQRQSKVVQNAENQVDQKSWMDHPMDEAEIFYVVYHAFILKLKKHSQVFKDEVLPKLYKMRHYQKSFLSQEKCEFLINLLGNRMPLHFEDVKI